MNFTIPTKTLNDGLNIPAIGFGTYSLKGAVGVNAIVSAIHAGYRMLDTAYNYENEGAVGQAVKRAGVAREEIRITSKLPGRYHDYSKAVVAVQESLFRAGLDYYDLYLIHWPNPRVDLYVEAWQALIDARKWGLIRSIGVCNFLPEHLERLEKETGVLPSINQIELHPYFAQQAAAAWNQEKGIVTEAWTPLGRKQNDLLVNPVIAQLAAKYGKSTAQIVLRWEVQRGIVPIPKASTLVRQNENLNVFDFVLSESEMDAIFALDRLDGRVAGQDPASYEEF